MKLPITVWQIVHGAEPSLELDDVVDRFEAVDDGDLDLRLAASGADACDVAIVPSGRLEIAERLGEVARIWLGAVPAPPGEVGFAPGAGHSAIVAALKLALSLAAVRTMRAARFEARAARRHARTVPIRTEPPVLSDFALHFQPQWRIDGELLIGAEALLRWHGLDVPGLRSESLIAAAESRGEMARVGDWVFERAAWQLSAWRDVWPSRARMGINVSASQLDDAELATRVDRALLAHRVDAERFELELSYDAIAHLSARQRAVVCDLVDLGVSFAIDRLGDAIIEPPVLERLPVRTWKLDRALVGAAADPAVAKLISELAALARNLEIRTIAVGVEDGREQRRLADLGCDALQGFLLAEPLPPEQCRALLAAHGERRRANGLKAARG